MVRSEADGHPRQNGHREEEHSPAGHSSRADGRPRHASQPSSHDGSARHTSSRRPEKKFLREVQDELEDQRQEWQFEIERLLSKNPMPTDMASKAQADGRNSYVDTSSGVPIFTAYVDVAEFSPKHISVNLDKITNKVVVKAEQRTGMGAVTKTFTEKVNLPRFADTERLTSRLSKKGVLKIEVPLMYYFPEQHDAKNGKPAKSFVYQVKTGRDGSERLEILVNTGTECSAQDLRVEVTGDGKLVIMANGSSANKSGGKLLKQYTLPELADIDHITSRLGRDGRLQVNVPLFRKRRE